MAGGVKSEGFLLDTLSGGVDRGRGGASRIRRKEEKEEEHANNL